MNDAIAAVIFIVVGLAWFFGNMIIIERARRRQTYDGQRPNGGRWDDD